MFYNFKLVNPRYIQERKSNQTTIQLVIQQHVRVQLWKVCNPNYTIPVEINEATAIQLFLFHTLILRQDQSAEDIQIGQDISVPWRLLNHGSMVELCYNT